MSGGIESRKHLRLSAMGPVEVVVQGGAPQMAFLASVGRGGVGLYLSQEVRAGQLVVVSLRLLARDADPEDLKTVSRVRWVRRAGAMWMAGFSFEQMSDARYTRLLQHLQIIEEWQLRELHGEVQPARAARFSAKD
jgi:hypothetical protein